MHYNPKIQWELYLMFLYCLTVLAIEYSIKYIVLTSTDCNIRYSDKLHMTVSHAVTKTFLQIKSWFFPILASA